MKTSSQRLCVQPDTLRWAIFMIVLGSTSAAAGGGLEAVNGTGGTPVINNGHGVPVIEIVAPNASGLSHNQFNHYNVERGGLVLNNATQAGQSQLAGALTANPQFQGQAASTILNEVVSRSASLIEGPQEIFGRAADYILANPNGITLNGGSFINTTRAGFLVGTPEFEQQRLKHLNTLDASGTLQVLGGGQGNAEGALALIAPRIDSQGLLTAASALDVVAGRNRVDPGNGVVVEHRTGTPSSIDASLFGAMQAGRIRVVSTAEGAGVRVQAPWLRAKEGIEIVSAGNLDVLGTAATPVVLHSEHGLLKLDAQGSLQLRTVQAKASQINARAGQALTLDAQALERVKHDNETWKKKFLFVTRETYDRETITTDTEQQGTRLEAADSIVLTSGNDMRMTAATVQAGNGLSLDSGGNLDILAGIGSQAIQETVRHRKDLWRGDSDTDTFNERAQGSTLAAGHMQVQAAGNLKVYGSSVHSRGDLTVTAAQGLIGTTPLQEHGARRSYRGDLVSGTFFGDRGDVDNQGQHLAGSTLTSDGVLTVTADKLTVKGSKVFGHQDATLYSQQGSLAVEADQGTSTRTDHVRDSKLFGLFANDNRSTERKEAVLVSEVGAQSNLRLASAQDLRIQGADVSAGNHLGLQAKGDVTITGAQATEQREVRTHQRGLTARASQTKEADGDKPGSRQYKASVGYEVATTTRQEQNVAYVGSQLKGATVSVNSDADAEVTGSSINALAGDVDIAARKVTLGATHNTRESTTTTVQSAGALALSGGIDRLGSQFDGHHQRGVLTERQHTAQRTTLQASGEVRLRGDELVTEGAQVKAGETLQVTATHMENRAVQDTSEQTQHQTDWSASLGASLEYRDLTRPIERLVMGEEAARFQQASPEDAMTAPSVGADMTVEHLKRLENQRRGFAQVSELSGASVQVRVDTLKDQGTAWRANAGMLDIQAQQHHLEAAAHTEHKREQRLAVGGEARLDTSTGQDVNVRAAGNGGSLDRQSTASTAVAGTLYGQQGIKVQLGSDGRYEGARFDGGDGDVRIHSEGTLSLAQSTDHQTRQSSQLDGNAWVKVGNRPGSTGVDGRGYLDQARTDHTLSTAHVAQIDSKGQVALTSRGDLMLEGTRIGSRDAPTGDITVHSDGQLHVKAATTTQTANGAKLGGGLELAAKTGTTRGGAVGGHFSHGKQEETSRQATDAQWASNGHVRLSSSAREEDALWVQGLQATAKDIALDATNGSMRLEASSNQELRNNLDVTAGAGFNASTGNLDTRGLHGRLKVDLDQRDNLNWNAGILRAERITLNSGGDASLAGVSLDAARIEGAVGGDLRVASLMDRVNSLSINGDARLSQEKNPQGYVNAATSLAGPLGGKVGEKAGSALSKADPGFSPTLRLEVTHEQRDNVAQQATIKGSEGVSLNVGGNAQLIGARLQSATGEVKLDADSIKQQTLSGSDYRRAVSIDASNSLADLGTAIADVAKSKGAAAGENALDLGLLRTSGHHRNEQWASSIGGKRD